MTSASCVMSVSSLFVSKFSLQRIGLGGPGLDLFNLGTAVERDLNLSVIVSEDKGIGLRVFPISRLDHVLVDGTAVGLPFVELIIPTPSGTHSWRPFVMDLMTSGGRRTSVCMIARMNKLLRHRNRGLCLLICLS
jgi:hypothetical protein